jgi:hypothetical protein
MRKAAIRRHREFATQHTPARGTAQLAICTRKRERMGKRNPRESRIEPDQPNTHAEGE